MPFESSPRTAAPVAPYVGGRRNLAIVIARRLAKIDRMKAA
jgi:hypothetical protein